MHIGDVWYNIGNTADVWKVRFNLRIAKGSGVDSIIMDFKGRGNTYGLEDLE